MVLSNYYKRSNDQLYLRSAMKMLLVLKKVKYQAITSMKQWMIKHLFQKYQIVVKKRQCVVKAGLCFWLCCCVSV